MRSDAGQSGGASGTTRMRVAAVAALAALQLSLHPGSVPAAPTGVEDAELARLDAPRVAEIVAAWNPTLSRRERERIGSAVVRYAAKYGLDPELVTAVLLVESSARPWARSPKGAQGLMQVMPYMSRPLGMAGNLATIETNVEAGCIILAGNIRRLGEDDGISAYFWGSKIRGEGYLQRVKNARDRVRRLSSS